MGPKKKPSSKVKHATRKNTISQFAEYEDDSDDLVCKFAECGEVFNTLYGLHKHYHQDHPEDHKNKKNMRRNASFKCGIC